MEIETSDDQTIRRQTSDVRHQTVRYQTVGRILGFCRQAQDRF